MRWPALFLFFLLAIGFFYFFLSRNSNFVSQNTSAITPTPSIAGPPAVLGVRTKTEGCQIQDKLPDPACTPGDAVSGVTDAIICVRGYSATVRNVPDSLKDQVYTEYGITSYFTGEYEVDHLISLELGGSNDISNLWPEAAEPRPGFHEKDQVENYLHREVCDGVMTLREAQGIISRNWMSVIVK